MTSSAHEYTHHGRKSPEEVPDTVGPWVENSTEQVESSTVHLGHLDIVVEVDWEVEMSKEDYSLT